MLIDLLIDIFSYSRRVFNQGLPEQFGFVTTFRGKREPRSRWHIIRITDARKNPQFAVALDPKRKSVELSLPKYDRTLQTLSWDVPQVCHQLLLCCYTSITLFTYVSLHLLSLGFHKRMA